MSSQVEPSSRQGTAVVVKGMAVTRATASRRQTSLAGQSSALNTMSGAGSPPEGAGVEVGGAEAEAGEAVARGAVRLGPPVAAGPPQATRATVTRTMPAR